MRRLVVVLAALVAAAAGVVMAWRRNPRLGSATMNARVNPFLVRRGLAGAGASEIGTLEHFGRRTGQRHLTPIHPVATPDGFRIVVPLGRQSEWARNVLAAGHCRLQLHDVVYGLDEPALLDAPELDDLSPAGRWIGRAFGIMYMRLHRFEEAPGALEPVDVAEAAEASAPTAAGAVPEVITATPG